MWWNMQYTCTYVTFHYTNMMTSPSGGNMVECISEGGWFSPRDPFHHVTPTEISYLYILFYFAKHPSSLYIYSTLLLEGVCTWIINRLKKKKWCENVPVHTLLIRFFPHWICHLFFCLFLGKWEKPEILKVLTVYNESSIDLSKDWSMYVFSMCVCMYVCLYACMYVCVFVCIFV